VCDIERKRVCVCVKDRERERERERGKLKVTPKRNMCIYFRWATVGKIHIKCLTV
jgi:hypothetical protein